MYQMACPQDENVILGSPYFRSLALQKYLLVKEGLSEEAIIQRWALDDALLYLDSVDADVFDSFMKQRVSYYERFMAKLSNITILDPSCFLEHQFCSECYQIEVKKIVKKYQEFLSVISCQEKETGLLHV